MRSEGKEHKGTARGEKGGTRQKKTNKKRKRTTSWELKAGNENRKRAKIGHQWRLGEPKKRWITFVSTHRRNGGYDATAPTPNAGS